jgi:hypothetical protein
LTRNEEFAKNGYVIIRNVLDEQTLELCATQFKLVKEVSKHISDMTEEEFESVNDNQVPNSFYQYGNFCFESLMVMLKPIVEDVIGKSLYPSYTYARIMNSGASMERHRDRPSCQFSLTLCIQDDKENPYPIFMENYGGIASSVLLNPGDMIVYHGTQLYHWREVWHGSEHIQTFFHYVDSNGPYKDYKYDKRPMLGLQK